MTVLLSLKFYFSLSTMLKKLVLSKPIRRLSSGIFFLLISHCVLAQMNIDSLKGVWKNSSQTDTARLEALHQLAWNAYLFTQPDSSFYFSQLQYDFASNVNNEKYMADALFVQGVSLTIRGEYREAIGYQEKSLALSEPLGDEAQIALSYNNLGINYAELGDLTSSMDYFVKFLTINEKLGNEVRSAGAMVNIGNMLIGIEEYAMAKDYLQRGVEKGVKIGHQGLIQNGSNGLGNVYYFEQKYDSALYHYRRCIGIAKSQNNLGGTVSPLGSIGVIHQKAGNFDSALINFNESLAIAEEIGSQTDISGSLINLGLLHLELGDSARANGNESRADELYSLTIASGERALKVAQEIQHKAKVEEAASLLSKVYEATNRHKESLEMFKLYIAERDSILSEKNEREVIRQGYQYEYDKRKLTDDLEHEAELEKEANRRFGLYIILGIVLIFSLLIFRAWRIRKRLSEELNQSYQKLKELTEYKESMTAMINHDLRSPLTLINGYVSRILTNQDNYLTTQTTEDLGNLKRNTVKLIEMSEEFQELLQLKEGRLQLNYAEVDLNHYLGVLVHMFDSVADDLGVQLTYSCQEAEIPVHLDLQHFDKVVYNLMTNALRHTNENGKVEVCLESGENACELTFQNTGKGISSEHINMIFDRYYQGEKAADGEHKGYGIGLAVVKELVESHGGSVSAISENGSISIKINWPYNLEKAVSEVATEPDAEKTAEVKAALRSTSPGMIGQLESDQAALLVVDDQKEIRNFIADSVQEYGTVKQASNGKEALKLLEKESVDLIITDLMMPWLDGFDLIEEIKKSDKLKAIPIIVISARTSEKDRLRILDHGVNNIIAKPFSTEELRKRITNLLQQKEDATNTWDQIVTGKDLISNVEQDILTKLNKIITERIDDPALTIEVIADELSASRSKAINLIKNLTGKTPLAYIKAIRMDYVSHLIKSEKVKNASEAASVIGMTNPTQFASQFKKHFGEKPFKGI